MTWQTPRILTVRQPWAWAIIHGGKDVENRVRNIAGNYRGPVAIHAGLTFDEPDGNDWELRRAITTQTNGWPADDGEVWSSDSIDSTDERFAPRGMIIGIVGLVAVHLGSPALGALHCSPWAEPDRWHLQLGNPLALAEPIRWQGGLGLRKCPPGLIHLIDEQLKETQ